MQEPQPDPPTESGRSRDRHSPGPQPLNRSALAIVVVCIVCTAVWFGISNRSIPEAASTVHSGATMGTSFRVTIAGSVPAGTSREEYNDAIDQRLEAVNRWMSTYRPDSELSQFNANLGTDWFDVSPETAFVVAEAQQIGELTGGAFDVTIGPLVNLWSFGPDDRPQQIPGANELEAAQESVGQNRLAVRGSPPAIKKSHTDVYVDLSGIAKGFGVDHVAAYLDEIGVTSYLIEIGGEMRAKGKKTDGTPWRVGLERPAETPDAPGQVLLSIELVDGSLATSGDYRNYFEVDGTRYSHTIDPRTGWPIEFGLASVSVLDESCMRADALATALMVLGADEGYNFAVEHDLAALFVLRSESGGYEQRATPEFENRLGRP